MKIINKFKLVTLLVLNFFFRITGRDWNNFYAWLLNRIERKNNFKNIKKIKRKYGFYSLDGGEDLKDVLIKHGLKKKNKVLDYGCGYGRVGIPLINYLDKNNYTGLDLSKERVRLAKEYVKEKKLLSKNPMLLVSHKKSLLELLGSTKYDIIVIYTVIVHNPLKNVEQIIKEVKNHLKPNGIIFFDYSEPTINDHYTNFLGLKIKLSVKDYRHTSIEINRILEKFKLNKSIIPYKNIKGHKWQLNKNYEENRRFVKAYNK